MSSRRGFRSRPRTTSRRPGRWPGRAGRWAAPPRSGHQTPREWGERTAAIRERVQAIAKFALSSHCHNDLGQAVANSLTAIMTGARQVECTINGIGERAGNASLEEIVMALRTRKDL